jgi:preprotein translocase subunit SecG
MEILNKIVFVVMLLSAFGVILLVLLQHGKGADMGTGFGAGASGSLFGATGSANFLSRTTKWCAAVFFMSTLALSYFASNRPHAASSVMQNLPAQTAPAPDATPAPAKAESAAPAKDAASAPAKPSEIPK